MIRYLKYTINITLQILLLFIFNTVEGQINPSCIEVQMSNIDCQNNDTKRLDDDNFTFDLSFSGGNSKWVFEFNNIAYTGEYNRKYTFGPYTLMEGPIFLIINDSLNQNCLGATTIFPPSNCESCLNRSIDLCQGDTIELTVSMELPWTPETLTNFQWYKDNSPISNAVDSFLIVTELGAYSVQATSGSSNCNFQSCCHYNVFENNSPQLEDDLFISCPNFSLENTVSTNDANLELPYYRLLSPPLNGQLRFDQQGDFKFTPFDTTCFTDQFIYEACNNNNDKCCDTAIVILQFGDIQAPTLFNVPKDITISCDENIPYPAYVNAKDDCPNISINIKEKSNQGHTDCALYNYTITRIWEASDACNNITLDTQLIAIQDKIAPDIFRIYTLPDGRKVIAGIMENVGQNWKTISFPIDFPTIPLVFNQIVTDKENGPIISRIRNVSKTQFELQIQTNVNNDRESVAWFAIEEENGLGNSPITTQNYSLTNAWKTVDFKNNAIGFPSFFATQQTSFNTIPTNVNLRNTMPNSVQMKIETTSSNLNESLLTERVGLLSIEQNRDLIDEKGAVFGETGKAIIKEEWSMIKTKHQYYNPVVIIGATFNNKGVVKLRKVTANGFEWKFQKNPNQNTLPSTQVIPYLLIEGSIPLADSSLCSKNVEQLEIGKDIIALDNCDNNIALQYDEQLLENGKDRQIIRTWYAADICGNATGYSQVITCSGIGLRLKALLQGAMIRNNRDGLMRDDLRKKGMIPLEEPYSDLQGYGHFGNGGGETCTAELLAMEGEQAIVDWVFIALKDKNNPDHTIATCAALIQRNGDVISFKGDTIIPFENIPPDVYYVSISHRNHLTVTSLYPYLFSTTNIPLVDFTNQFTPSFGRHPFVEMEKKNTLWSGDLNGDQQTIFQGPNNDIFDIFSHAITDVFNKNYLVNFISTGYTENDFNMDGIVIFQGPNNDRANLLYNTILKHPDNSILQPNFLLSTTEKVEAENIETCYNNPTHLICDFDGDGRLNKDDVDDDNDGVIDGDDVDPYNPYSDSDQDGISDKEETNGDGIYQPETDSNPLNPCDPFQTINRCEGVDEDQDGLFENYPDTHHLYDTDDADNCNLPLTANTLNCNCPDTDDDGYIFVCHQNGRKKQTIKIRLAEWRFRKKIGDTCGICQD